MPNLIQPETMCKYLQDTPLTKLIEFINGQKDVDIQKILSKIVALAHFSQSMTDYFAHDDALEPALAVVCEVLRHNVDSGDFLGKTTHF